MREEKEDEEEDDSYNDNSDGYDNYVNCGNGDIDNRDMIIPEKWHDKIVQTVLSPGECSFHDGKCNLLT